MCLRKLKIKSQEEKRIEALETENAELLFKSAIAEMEVESFKDENAELMFRIATLEMGGHA